MSPCSANWPVTQDELLALSKLIPSAQRRPPQGFLRFHESDPQDGLESRRPRLQPLPSPLLPALPAVSAAIPPLGSLTKPPVAQGPWTECETAQRKMSASWGLAECTGAPGSPRKDSLTLPHCLAAWSEEHSPGQGTLGSPSAQEANGIAGAASDKR